MKRYLKTIVLAAFLLLVSPVWASNITPDRLVDETVQEVMRIISQDKAIKEGDKNRIYSLVEDKILPHFNFTRMTKLAMGKNWKKATPEQQNELVNAFRTLLVRTYSNALSDFSDEIVKVSPIKNLGNNIDATVKTRVIQGNSKQPVPINYSMRKTDDSWKIYDVTVSGVSLVTNYRGSFNSQIRRGGVGGLIKKLNKKNNSLKDK